jgi:hypothetical protein
MASILVLLYFQKEPQSRLKMQYSRILSTFVYMDIMTNANDSYGHLVVSGCNASKFIYLLPYPINRLSNGVIDLPKACM